MSIDIAPKTLLTDGTRRFEVVATAEQEGRPVGWLRATDTGALASKFIDEASGLTVVPPEFERRARYTVKPEKAGVAGPPELAEGTSLEVVKLSPNYAYLMYKKEGQPFGWHIWTVKKKFIKNYDKV